MTAKTESPMEKLNVRLWQSDIEYLKHHYPDNYNAQLRRIVQNWIVKHRREHTHAQETRQV